MAVECANSGCESGGQSCGTSGNERQGQIAAAAKRERFDGVKHPPICPFQAIAWSLEQAGLVAGIERGNFVRARVGGKLQLHVRGYSKGRRPGAGGAFGPSSGADQANDDALDRVPRPFLAIALWHPRASQDWEPFWGCPGFPWREGQR